MLLLTFVCLFAVSASEESVKVISSDVDAETGLSEGYAAELLHLNDLKDKEDYCNLVKTTAFGRHRPQWKGRSTRALQLVTRFSHDDIHAMTVEDWRELLRERFDLRCDAHSYRPRARDQRLREYPELSCHTICRACFHESLPICLRRNIDNDFGITCYCTYDGLSPLENHVFRISD